MTAWISSMLRFCTDDPDSDHAASVRFGSAFWGRSYEPLHVKETGDFLWAKLIVQIKPNRMIVRLVVREFAAELDTNPVCNESASHIERPNDCSKIKILMTGAMAGSTATLYRNVSNRLRVVTLTVNNRCNLRCPHCYLQYDGRTGGASEITLDAVVESQACHIAIVGKEPLVDATSAAATERLVARCAANGKTVSLITNGLGLHRLSSASLAKLEWIDVSLDGGPETYSQYRRGDFARVIGNVRESLKHGARIVNVLHTVSSQNLQNVEDMMAVTEMADWNKIVFSPYAEVRNHGSNPTSPVSLKSLLTALAGSKRFLRHSPAFILIGSHAFSDQGLDAEAVARTIQASGLSERVFRVEHDPLLLGYLRVTYDGYIMTPSQSLHPTDYRNFASPLHRYASLDHAFQHLRAA